MALNFPNNPQTGDTYLAPNNQLYLYDGEKWIGFVTPAGTIAQGITFVGDDSSGTRVSDNETIKIAGAGTITTSMSGDTITITGSASAQGITFVGDDSTGTRVSDGESFKIAGTQNVSTAVSGDTLTITGSKDINVNSITSSDSSAIQINDAVNISGAVTANAGLTINNNGNTWLFDTNGTLTLPNSGKISSSYPPGGSPTGEAWFVTSASNSGGIASADGRQYIQVNNGQPIIIGTGWPTTHFEWRFGLDGTLTFPDSTTQNTAARIIVVGDDSTGVTLNAGETIKIAGTQNISTAVSGDTLTITGPNLSSYLTAVPKTIDVNSISSSDSSAIQINDAVNVSGLLTANSGLTVNNSGNTWQFSSDGTTKFPSNTINAGTQSIDIKSSYYAQLWYHAADGAWQSNPNVNQDVYLYVDSGGAHIQSVRPADGNGSPTWSHTWNFANDGALQLPKGGTIVEGTSPTGVGKTITLKPDGGLSTQALLIYPTAGPGEGDHIHLTAGGGSTELYLGNDLHYVKLVNGGNVEIQATGGVPNSISNINSNGGWNSSPYTNLATTGGTGTGLTVNASSPGNGYLNTITINTAGSGYTNGDVITITNENNLTATFNIGIIKGNWTFGTDGSLASEEFKIKTPNGIPTSIGTTSNDTQFWDANYGSNLATTGGTGTGLTVNVGDAGSGFASVSINTPGTGYTAGDVITVTNGPLNGAPIASSVTFTIGISGTRSWTFDKYGGITFSDSTTQNTAARITIVGDDSTGTTLNAGETIKIAGAGSVTTSVSGDTITITGTGGGASIGDLTVDGTTISSGSSSKITLNESVDITGTLQVNDINSADSSAIQINDAVNVSGTLTANTIQTNQISSTESTAIQINDSLNASGTITATTFVTHGTGGSITGVNTLQVNEISSADSTAIQINDGVNISGTLNAKTLIANTISSEDSTAIQINDGLRISGNLTFSDNTVQTTAYVTASGNWTVTTGTNTYSFTVPSDGTYTMWVKGNIANGIIIWNATVSVSNTNVPAIGYQYAWNYTGGGSPIALTAIPDQIRGTAGTISTDATYAGSTSNRFDFGISNSSGASQTIYYGYAKIS
jgi:hypothetical protein